ncbi:uncharacterized protein LOC132751771 [Ruditapes philippinarum]|uniref:uncharacterized protein LOC132751771 n=1 Tax=Ruditapes philippinarum TaxID=129788 RepID=UPI00295B7826|nr:uncharacterized protein LOC132751771 [Ruditapes philippinarum]
MATCRNIWSSEEAYDYNCTPCSQEGRFVKAKRFCVECGEYFCSTCLACHEKFGVSKGHTLIKCEEVSKDQVPARLSKCELHTDKEEDMVCSDHDVVCCRVCITTCHRSCQNIDYLPHLMKKYKDYEKCVEVEKEMKDRIEELSTAHKEYSARALKLKTRKITYLKRLEILGQTIDKCVKNAITETEKNVENRFEPEICDLQDHTQNYKEMLVKFSCLSEELSKENDDLLEFKKILECKRALKEIEVESYGFVLNECFIIDNKFQKKIVESVVSCLENELLFGTILIGGPENSFGAPNLCVKDYESSFLVLSADYDNRKIRRIDSYLKESESFDVEGNIWGICEINKHEIAFTLPGLNKVQFLSIYKGPVLTISFISNFHCRGIACFDEKIYVTGGGKKGEEYGQLNVFDLEGKLLCKSYQDFGENFFSIPRSIIVNAEGVFITDEQNGVISLDLEGQRKWVCNNSKCKFPWGICFTRNGNLFVCGRDSNNIVIVSKDGEFLGELLNVNDGLSAPKALSTDKGNNFIIISEYKKPQLKIFYIGDCDI